MHNVVKIDIWERPTGAEREPDWKWRLRWLLESLQLLAADAETLIRYYPPMIPAADDLVNNFADHVEFASPLVEQGVITQEQLEKARAVHAKIHEMSNRHDTSLWTYDALRTREEWTEVRRLAKGALQAMGYGLEPPPLGRQLWRVVFARESLGNRLRRRLRGWVHSGTPRKGS